MSMHLVKPSLTTTSTKKRKSSISVTPQLRKECKDHNKLMKKHGLKVKTIEDYLAYRQGNYDPKLGSVVASPVQAKSLQRTTPVLPSSNVIDVALARKPNEYTGTLVTGIATMHKSNAVPVINKKQMEEISKMRRG